MCRFKRLKLKWLNLSFSIADFLTEIWMEPLLTSSLKINTKDSLVVEYHRDFRETLDHPKLDCTKKSKIPFSAIFIFRCWIQNVGSSVESKNPESCNLSTFPFRSFSQSKIWIEISVHIWYCELKFIKQNTTWLAARHASNHHRCLFFRT